MSRTMLSIRLLLQDRMAIGAFVASALLFTFLCSSLNSSATKLSNLPIGVFNQDLIDGTENLTELSSNLYDRICDLESFRVVTGDKKTLLNRLSDGELFCVFEIKKGYEKQVLLGNEKDLVTVYEPEESKISNFISDIFAGQIFSDLCMAKAYQSYEGVEKTQEQELTQEEFYALADQINENEDYTFVFQYELVDAGGKEDSYQEMDNAILYRQMVAGVSAILLSFVILFSYTFVCLEKENGIRKRKRLAGSSRVAEFLGTLPATLLLSLLLSVIFCAVLCFFTDGMERFTAYLVACIAYLLVMSLLFYLLCLFCSDIKSYQVLGTMLVLICGVAGILYVIKDVIGIQLKMLEVCNPNCWFIRRIVDIMIKKSP